MASASASSEVVSRAGRRTMRCCWPGSSAEATSVVAPSPNAKRDEETRRSIPTSARGANGPSSSDNLQAKPSPAATNPVAASSSGTASSGGTAEKDKKETKSWRARLKDKLQWPTLQPNSPLLKNLMLFLFLFTTYNAIVIPFRWSFLRGNKERWTIIFHIIDYTGDTLLWVHLALSYNSICYHEDGLAITERAKIRKHYIRTHAFLYDVVSLLPIDFIAFLAGYDDYVFLRMIRFVRLPQAMGVFGMWEYGALYANAIRLVKSLMILTMMIHWVSCIYYWVVLSDGFGSSDWVLGDDPFLMDNLDVQYFRCAIWTMQVLLQQVDGTPSTRSQVYLTVAVMFLGLSAFAAFVGGISSLITNLNASEVVFRQKMDVLSQFMAYRRLPASLQQRIMNYQDYMWRRQRGLDDREILGDLPPHLQNEIARYLNREILQKVPLFSNADSGFLSELVTRLKPRLYGPGEYIVRYGEVGREMFFISRGEVEVCSEDGRTVFKCMADGEYFGEIALLYSDKRTASVRAKGYCDLFTLNREDLEAVLVDYPEVHAMLREVARSRMTGGHVPQKKPASASLNGGTGSSRNQMRRSSSVTAMVGGAGRGTLSRNSSFNDQNRMAQVQRAQWALRTIRRFIHAWILIHRNRKAGMATAEPLRNLLERKPSTDSMSQLFSSGGAGTPVGTSPTEKAAGLSALLPSSRSFSKTAKKPDAATLRRRSNSLPTADASTVANAAAAAAAIAAAAAPEPPAPEEERRDSAAGLSRDSAAGLSRDSAAGLSLMTPAGKLDLPLLPRSRHKATLSPIPSPNATSRRFELSEVEEGDENEENEEEQDDVERAASLISQHSTSKRSVREAPLSRSTASEPPTSPPLHAKDAPKEAPSPGANSLNGREGKGLLYASAVMTMLGLGGGSAPPGPRPPARPPEYVVLGGAEAGGAGGRASPKVPPSVLQPFLPGVPRGSPRARTVVEAPTLPLTLPGEDPVPSLIELSAREPYHASSRASRAESPKLEGRRPSHGNVPPPIGGTPERGTPPPGGGGSPAQPSGSSPAHSGAQPNAGHGSLRSLSAPLAAAAASAGVPAVLANVSLRRRLMERDAPPAVPLSDPSSPGAVPSIPIPLMVIPPSRPETDRTARTSRTARSLKNTVSLIDSDAPLPAPSSSSSHPPSSSAVPSAHPLPAPVSLLSTALDGDTDTVLLSAARKLAQLSEDVLSGKVPSESHAGSDTTSPPVAESAPAAGASHSAAAAGPASWTRPPPPPAHGPGVHSSTKKFVLMPAVNLLSDAPEEGK